MQYTVRSCVGCVRVDGVAEIPAYALVVVGALLHHGSSANYQTATLLGFTGGLPLLGIALLSFGPRDWAQAVVRPDDASD
jgi:hypothetical protein